MDWEGFDADDVTELLEQKETKIYKVDKLKMEKEEEMPVASDDRYRTHMSWMPTEVEAKETPLIFIPPSGEKEYKSRR